jgi:hypothetical protein
VAAVAELSTVAGKTMMMVNVAIHYHGQKAKQRAPSKNPIPKLLQPAMTTDKTNKTTKRLS